MPNKVEKANLTEQLNEEVYSAIIDAWCLFDAAGNLQDWSSGLVTHYPPMRDEVVVGMHYREFVRALVAKAAVQNIHHVENVDAWIDKQLDVVGKTAVDFCHHLLDGRWMMIRHTPMATGEWLFSSIDVSNVRAEKSLDISGDEKHREFASLSSDWYWELDENLNYLYHSSHKQPLAGDSVESLVGKSRILELNGRVVDNEELHRHNRLFNEHAYVDVTLSWVLKDQSKKHSRIFAKPMHDNFGRFKGYIGCGRDVTSQFEMSERLSHLANHDDLTGLLNRRAFAERLDNLLRSRSNKNNRLAAAASERQFSLICINLDRFKLVNDDAGHQAGDQLLIEITALLKDQFAHGIEIARLAGDEFGVVVKTDEIEAVEQSEVMINRIAEFSFEWQRRRFSIGASAGVVALNEGVLSSSDFLSRVDIACYSAKLAGRNQVQLYSSQCSQLTQQNEELLKIKMLKFALNNDGLRLFLQPIVPARAVDERIKYEVLLRVRDIEGKLISPGEVIPVAEKYDLMHELDLWVVESSLKNIHRFHEMGVQVVLSVNLSGNTLSNKRTLQQIVELVESYELPKGSLCLEITETAAIKELEQVCEFIHQLRCLGCRFSLDDFGSGLSSFKYLKSLKVDFLKIDGSFVKNICEDEASLAIVTSFNTLSHSMGMKTIAEFVENDQIAKILCELDIDYLQGYGVGKPRDINECYVEFENDLRHFGT